MSIDFAELYKLFLDVTPLWADCGRLCGSICCRDDADPDGGVAGMRLLPGEEPAPAADGRVLSAVRSDGAPVSLFVCRGRCKRETRPIACRIFPLFPYLSRSGRLRVIYDPRAFRLCPLVRCRTHVRLRRDFVRAVAATGHRLCRDAAGRAFLRAESREIDEWATLGGGLLAPESAAIGPKVEKRTAAAFRRNRKAACFTPPFRRSARRSSRRQHNRPIY